MQKQAHMGDQAGSSRDVDAPAAPPVTEASSVPPHPRPPTRAACGRCRRACSSRRERERERERADGLSRRAAPIISKSQGGRDQMGSPPPAAPHHLQKSRRERGKSRQGQNHHKGQITASLIRIRKQPNAPRDYCKN